MDTLEDTLAMEDAQQMIEEAEDRIAEMLEESLTEVGDALLRVEGEDHDTCSWHLSMTLNDCGRIQTNHLRVCGCTFPLALCDSERR